MEGLVFDPLLKKMVAISEKFDLEFLSDFCANLCAIVIFAILGIIYIFCKKVLCYLCVFTS